MIESMAIILAGAIWTLTILIFIDQHIKRLIDKAFRVRCGNCEFKNSKIPETKTEQAV